jgi:hypothetical protein
MVEYYQNPALSQSKLKLLLTNPTLFETVREPEMFYEEKKHFVVGSAVDCLLTTPDIFDETYHISDVHSKPSDTIKSILNQVYSCVNEDEEILTIDQYHDLIIQFCDSHEYSMAWKNATRFNKVCEGYEYFEDLKSSKGKQVLSVDEKTLIDSIVMSIKSNEVTGAYLQEVKGLHKHYQLPLYFEYEGEDCKALLDLVIFDHDSKIIEPIDFKTLGDYVLNFPKAMRQRRYDIQAAFYTEALKAKYPDYTILPFKFIVESTINPGTPLVFTCHPQLLRIGKVGRPAGYTEVKHLDGTSYSLRVQEIKGFHQLIELYKYYTSNGFELDQVIREKNSELTIDWSGIIV